MKKIFTLTTILFASLAMMAQTITLATATKENNWYEELGVGRVTNKSGNAFSDPDMASDCPGSIGYKTGSSYFTVQTYQQISGLTIWARSTSNRKIKAITVSEAIKSSAQSASNVEFERTGGNETYAVPKNICDNEFTLSFTNAVAADSYIQIVLDGNAEIVAVTFVGGTPSTDPILTVNPESVTLNVTASNSNPSATVKFVGKNLTAGTYNLSVPSVAGLSATPNSVTIGEDGKLNQEVTIAYTSTVDVVAASADVSLTIGALTKTVAVNYSAALTKQYINQSFNIEQLVLDNGTKYDIKSAFTAANVEYNNLDALDSLNDDYSKTNRNYAFLGLKLKKADASVACWLQSGATINVKFGNVGADFQVKVNGAAQTLTAANFANTTPESANVLSYTATADTYLEIVCNSTKTLVIKQIMLNELPQAVVLPAPSVYTVTCADAENGTVTLANGKKQGSFAPGATVELKVTPADGYLCNSLTWNGTELKDDVPGQAITFTMPAEAVTVAATFANSFPTAIGNTEVENTAVKMIENGQLMIIKNGLKYNAQGVVVK